MCGCRHLAAELDRIAEQVFQQHTLTSRVAIGMQIGHDRHAHRLDCIRQQPRGDIADHCRQIQPGARQVLLRGARQRQQVVDQLIHAEAVGENALQHLQFKRIEARGDVFFRALGKADNGAQRRADRARPVGEALQFAWLTCSSSAVRCTTRCSSASLVSAHPGFGPTDRPPAAAGW